MSWKNAYRGARRDTRRARPPADAPPVFAYRRRASLPAMVNDRARADATPGILPLATDEFAGFSGSGFAAVTMASRSTGAGSASRGYPTPPSRAPPVGGPSKSIDYSPDASEPRPESSPSPGQARRTPPGHIDDSTPTPSAPCATSPPPSKSTACASNPPRDRNPPPPRLTSPPRSPPRSVAPSSPRSPRARGEGTDVKDADADARSPLAYSPALAAVVAKAVAGKMLTLEEKGALHRAVELQEKRRRAAATGAAASPYDPHTPASRSGRQRRGRRRRRETATTGR